jgi:hypothetical protein
VFIQIPEAKITVNCYNAKWKFRFSNIKIVLVNLTSSEKKAVWHTFIQDFFLNIIECNFPNVGTCCGIDTRGHSIPLTTLSVHEVTSRQH